MNFNFFDEFFSFTGEIQSKLHATSYWLLYQEGTHSNTVEKVEGKEYVKHNESYDKNILS
jgi:hypothetical protein